MPKFSIVVTVYNKEAELRRCLDSIKRQSFEDWETILIDDGSIDSSLKICREYENSDKRFRIISQQNKGYSGAKNTGMDHAAGTYILFVDADDFIEPLTLEAAYRGMEEHGVDLVIGGVNVRIFDKDEQVGLTTGVPEENYFFHMKDLPVAGPYLWEVNGTLFYCAWSKVYRMDIIRAYGLRFNENLPVQEDVEFVYRYYYHCGDCMVSNEVFYNYCRPIDKDDVGEKPQIDQHRYVEQSLISFLQVIYKFNYPEPYRQLMYEKTFEHYIKLSSKIFLPSTGLSVDEQKHHIKSMTDDFAFRFFCEKLGPVDLFWKRMSELSAEKDYETLYSEWGRKIAEGVVPPCT
jgi:glycosyltransferase involved in cell wall biosynthesis